MRTCAEVAEKHLETVEAHEGEVAQLVVQLAVIQSTPKGRQSVAWPA